MLIPIGQIWADDSRNPRRDEAPDRGLALARSIRAIGIIQPIAVVPEPGPGGEQYRVVAGYGRFRAAVAVDLDSVPVSVVEVPPGGDGELLIALAENETRAALTSWDRCDGIARLIASGMPIDTVALVLAEEDGTKPLSGQTIRTMHAIARLPGPVGARLRSMGAIGYGVARRLASTPGLRQGVTWWPDATEKAMADVIRAMGGERAPAPAHPGEDAPAQAPRAGWRYRSATVRARLATVAERDHPALMLARWLAGEDIPPDDLSVALGPRILEIVRGR